MNVTVRMRMSHQEHTCRHNTQRQYRAGTLSLLFYVHRLHCRVGLEVLSNGHRVLGMLGGIKGRMRMFLKDE